MFRLAQPSNQISLYTNIRHAIDIIENLEGVCEVIHAEVLNRCNDIQENESLFQQMKGKR